MSISIIFLYCVLTVTVWMLITQTWRYLMHRKAHDYDPEDSQSYQLAHQASAIYWLVPMVFVFAAALIGGFITELVENQVPSVAVGSWEYLLPMAASLGAYIIMDLQKGSQGIICKICNALYYYLVESKKGSEEASAAVSNADLANVLKALGDALAQQKK